MRPKRIFYGWYVVVGVAMVSLVTYLFDTGVIEEGRTYMTLVGLGL